MLSKFIKNALKFARDVSFTFITVAAAVNNAYAAEAPKLISGTVSLFTAISSWLLLIIPVGAGAFLGLQALQKSLTDDQAVIAEKNKMMKNTLIGAAIAMTADGLVRIVLGFYQ